jgi:hypothetical protein
VRFRDRPIASLTPALGREPPRGQNWEWPLSARARTKAANPESAKHCLWPNVGYLDGLAPKQSVAKPPQQAGQWGFWADAPNPAPMRRKPILRKPLLTGKVI